MGKYNNNNNIIFICEIESSLEAGCNYSLQTLLNSIDILIFFVMYLHILNQFHMCVFHISLSSSSFQ